MQSDQQNRGGQWFHRIGAEPLSPRATRPQPKPRAKQKPPGLSPPGKFRDAAKAAKAFLPPWCERYCVPPAAWIAIGAVANEFRVQVPEVSPADPGETTAVVQRFAVADKGQRWKAGRGHRRGVTMQEGLPNGSAPVLIVEGSSDTAAGVAAGFEAIGRSTRDANLFELAPLFGDLPPDTPIILLVERDAAPANSGHSDETWLASLIAAAKDRAKLLANIIERPVIVATPPPGFNDFADWWRHSSEGFGHLLSQPERHAIGREMLLHLTSTGQEVLPSAEQIASARKTIADQAIGVVLAQAEADLRRAGRCQWAKYRSFTKSEEGRVQYMFAKLSCKTWRCISCRTSKVIPTWFEHLATVLAEHDRDIYRVRLSGTDSENHLKAAKQYARRQRGKYVAIKTPGHFSFFCTTEPKDFATRYRLGAATDYFRRLLDDIEADIWSIDGRDRRPISTCRAWAMDRPEPEWTRYIDGVPPSEAAAAVDFFKLRAREQDKSIGLMASEATAGKGGDIQEVCFVSALGEEADEKFRERMELRGEFSFDL